MEPAMHQSSVRAVWADALFVSALQRCDQPSAEQVRQAIAVAVGVFGPHGCAERVAQEFGDHPETAVTRMRWARELAAEAISGRQPEPGKFFITAHYSGYPAVSCGSARLTSTR